MLFQIGGSTANSILPPTGNFQDFFFGALLFLFFSWVRASFIFGDGLGFSGIIVVWDFLCFLSVSDDGSGRSRAIICIAHEK